MAIPMYPQRKPGNAFRAVDDEGGLVVQPGRSEVAVLNNVGIFVFGLLDGRHSVDDLLEAVVREFDVTQDQARVDVEAFLQQLDDQGLLGESGPDDARSA